MMDSSVTLWLDRFKAGEREAAQALWERYYAQLVRYVKSRLHGASRRAADEEDLALSAFDSLFRGIEAGRFPQLDDRDDLWQILLVIAQRKAADQILHERRQKRGGGRVRGQSVFENRGDGPAPGLDQHADDGPPPELAAEITEQVRRLMDLLPQDSLRVIAQRKLEGYDNPEIAAELDCGLRTVERKLRLIRSLWEREQA